MLFSPTAIQIIPCLSTLGPHHFSMTLGSIEVWPATTAAAVTRVDSRKTGSLDIGSARSSWSRIHIDVHAPALPPVRAIRDFLIFHSPAFDRRNCTALAASNTGAGSGSVPVRR